MTCVAQGARANCAMSGPSPWEPASSPPELPPALQPSTDLFVEHDENVVVSLVKDLGRLLPPALRRGTFRHISGETPVQESNDLLLVLLIRYLRRELLGQTWVND